VIPIIIVIVLVLASGRVIHEVHAAPKPPNAVLEASAGGDASQRTT
jgi:hypothetical protein